MQTLLLAAALALAQQFGPVDGRNLAPTELDRVGPGIAAPDFLLPDGAGGSFALSGFRGRNVVLVFYRGHW